MALPKCFHHSKETIRKISEHHRRFQTKETKKKLSEIRKKNNPGAFKKGHKINVGKKRTREQKINIGLINKGNKYALGMKHTLEWSEKRSLESRGRNNPFWQGGKTELQKIIRSGLKYRLWRSDIFTRDDFICQKCGIRGGDLEAHHIKEFSLILKENNIKTLEEAEKCEELWNLNNGRTLCLNCHKKTF